MFFLIFIFIFAMGFALDLSHLDLNELLELMKMMDLKKFLGGDVQVDKWFPLVKYPSLLGQFKLSCASDLTCDSFDELGTPPCRWRNEWSICGSGDELDFVRACGKWGDEQADTIFNTKARPEGSFLLAGTKKKLPSEHSAMLVSDPIQCQQGDGLIAFFHWKSPLVKIRVCTRSPGSGKIYDWCSEPVDTPTPGPSSVVIPGSRMHTFEIVIEAFNFVLDNFGQQGGIAVIDTVEYQAQAIYNCAFLPHVDKPPLWNFDTCRKLTCDFDTRNCISQDDEEEDESDFHIASSHVGSYHAGIRVPIKGDYAYARGPSANSFELGPLNISRTAMLEFCAYRSTVYSHIEVLLQTDDGNETVIFANKGSYLVHSWQCERVSMPTGEYESLVFKVSKMQSRHSYVGFDEISLVDASTGQSCMNEERRTIPKQFLSDYKEETTTSSSDVSNEEIKTENDTSQSPNSETSFSFP